MLGPRLPQHRENNQTGKLANTTIPPADGKLLLYNKKMMCANNSTTKILTSRNLKSKSRYKYKYL